MQLKRTRFNLHMRHHLYRWITSTGHAILFLRSSLGGFSSVVTHSEHTITLNLDCSCCKWVRADSHNNDSFSIGLKGISWFESVFGTKHIWPDICKYHTHFSPDCRWWVTLKCKPIMWHVRDIRVQPKWCWIPCIVLIIVMQCCCQRSVQMDPNTLRFSVSYRCFEVRTPMTIFIIPLS